MLGSVLSIFSTLWEWKGVIIIGLVVVGFLMAYGFLKPLLDILTRTYLEFILPLAVKAVSTPQGRAIVFGILAFGLLVGTWFWADSEGYKRAQGECNTTIAMRERNEAVAEVERLRSRLAVLEQARLQDATRALADAEQDRINQGKLDAIPETGRPCFDESMARRLWGK